MMASSSHMTVGSPSRAMTDGADDRSGLVAAIRQLVRHIERIRDGNPSARGGVGVRRWQGGGYVYVEAALKSDEADEIDVNVHDGRVFVRIANDDGPG